MEKGNIFKDRLLEQYENLTDFCTRSGVPVSQETCRKFIMERKKINTTSFMLICHHLGFTPNEIRNMLKTDKHTIYRPQEQKLPTTGTKIRRRFCGAYRRSRCDVHSTG
jgi:hypothetical protein